MKNLISYLFPALCVLLIVAISIIVLEIGLGRQEVSECEHWQSQVGLSGYYLMDWQVEQCSSIGRPIDSVQIKE